MTFALKGNAICPFPPALLSMSAPASFVPLTALRTSPIWFSTAPLMITCALNTQTYFPKTCPIPFLAFCLKTRLELPHLSMIAMFYAAETRV